MAVLGASVLLIPGLLGVLATWNAAKPLVDPTRRYSPWWLPSMIVIELAPFWLIVHIAVAAAGLALGGGRALVGRIGLALLAMSTLLLVWIVARSAIGVRKLRRLVQGPVHPAVGVAGILGRPIRTPDAVDERHDIEWTDELTCDLIRPRGADRPLPTCVYVHGGGWTGGDPQRQARDLYHALALAGWATVAIRYPFAPHADVEVQIDTVRAAVRWARSGLAEHGVDATDVVLAGGSAGAHLAVMAALTTSEPSERVAACAGLYGVYDMANRNRLRAPWTKIPQTVMRATVEERPDRYRAVSPLDQDLDGSPPMLIVHGTHDSLVPIEEGQQFVDVLRAAGRPVDFVPVYGAQHAFDALSSVTSRTTAAVIRDWLVRNVPT